MEKDNVLSLAAPVAESSASRGVLEELVRSGARRILQEALEGEVEEFLAQLREGRESVPAVAVRNGHLPARRLVTGIGPLEVQQPRVRMRFNFHQVGAAAKTPSSPATESADRFNLHKSSEAVVPMLINTATIYWNLFLA
jgi:hypothetical protein